MDEDARPEPAEDEVPDDEVPDPVQAMRRHERLAALHEALAARGSGDVVDHARKAKAHREEADRLRDTAESGDDTPR